MPAQYPTGLNGWLYMSRAQYNAITPDAYTKYTVKDGDEVHEYLGDVEITAEDGTTWVTMAYYEVDQQAVHDVIDSIYDDVEDLKSWRTVTIAPWKTDITSRVEALESWYADVADDVADMAEFMDEFNIDELTTWKASVNASLQSINTAIASIQSSLTIIDVVSSVPVSPVSTTLYVVDGGSS